MKVCTCCHINKDNSCFRLRKDKRDGRVFLNNWCRDCENIKAMEYYNKVKDDPLFKKKNVEHTNRYREKYPEKVKAQQKIKRDRPENKIRRKKYDKENKDRISILSKKRNLKYVRKIVADISDSYVISQLRSEFYKKNGYCAGVIFDKIQVQERKRRIALHRLNKVLKTLNNEEQNRGFTESFICTDGEA